MKNDAHEQLSTTVTVISQCQAWHDEELVHRTCHR